MSVAVSIGSISLLADGVDDLEDTAVNILIAVALGWSASARGRMGTAMAITILLPAVFAAWQAFEKFDDPVSPDALIMIIAGLIVNGICAYLLVSWRVDDEGGVACRPTHLAIVIVALVTLWVGNGWPDILAGLLILLINLGAAKEVWEAATERMSSSNPWARQMR